MAALLALFVAYQLWGTGFAQSRSQHSLRQQLEHSLSGQRVTPGGSSSAPARSVGNRARLAAWGLACAALVRGTLAARRHLAGKGTWIAPVVALPVATAVLFFLFGAVNTMLPASF